MQELWNWLDCFSVPFCPVTLRKTASGLICKCIFHPACEYSDIVIESNAKVSADGLLQLFSWLAYLETH